MREAAAEEGPEGPTTTATAVHQQQQQQHRKGGGVAFASASASPGNEGDEKKRPESNEGGEPGCSPNTTNKDNKHHHQQEEGEGEEELSEEEEEGGGLRRRGGPSSSSFSSRSILLKRLGEEEHTAISQVLSLQQGQFDYQVQELHHISQRQWQHVSRTLFPCLENFRPALSGVGGVNPSTASPLFSAGGSSNLMQAAQDQKTASPAVSNQGGAWWHDPMKVLGMQHLPSILQGSMSLPQSSSQMESTMVGSHHPSLNVNPGVDHHQQQQQDLSRQQESSIGLVNPISMTGSKNLLDASEPSEAAKRPRPVAGVGESSKNHLPDQQNPREKRLKEGGFQRVVGATIAKSEGAELTQQMPLSCPKPKVATPQSAIDILLALSDTATGDANASIAPAKEENAKKASS